MKQVLLLTILILIFCLQGFGQNSNETKPVVDCGTPIPNFQEKPWEHTFLKLQTLIIATQGEPGSKATLIFSVTNRNELNSVIKIQKRILKELKKFGIPKNQIITKIEKGKVYETTVEFIPPKVSIL